MKIAASTLKPAGSTAPTVQIDARRKTFAPCSSMEGSTITIARWELYAMIAAIVLGPLIVNEAWRAATPSAASAQVVSVVRGIFAPWSRLARPWYRAGGMHVTPLISVGTIVVPALFFGG